MLCYASIMPKEHTCSISQSYEKARSYTKYNKPAVEEKSDLLEVKQEEPVKGARK